MTENDLAKIVVDKAFKVHNALGPGLLESAYEKCLLFELQNINLKVEAQKELPIIYEGNHLNCGYRLDLLINDKLIIEVKSIDTINSIHVAQVLTYLKLSKCKLALLINFNQIKIKDGIRRIVNNL